MAEKRLKKLKKRQTVAFLYYFSDRRVFQDVGF